MNAGGSPSENSTFPDRFGVDELVREVDWPQRGQQRRTCPANRPGGRAEHRLGSRSPSTWSPTVHGMSWGDPPARHRDGRQRGVQRPAAGDQLRPRGETRTSRRWLQTPAARPVQPCAIQSLVAARTGGAPEAGPVSGRRPPRSSGSPAPGRRLEHDLPGQPGGFPVRPPAHRDDAGDPNAASASAGRRRWCPGAVVSGAVVSGAVVSGAALSESRRSESTMQATIATPVLAAQGFTSAPESRRSFGKTDLLLVLWGADRWITGHHVQDVSHGT